MDQAPQDTVLGMGRPDGTDGRLRFPAGEGVSFDFSTDRQAKVPRYEFEFVLNKRAEKSHVFLGLGEGKNTAGGEFIVSALVGKSGQDFVTVPWFEFYLNIETVSLTSLLK
ncbi:MAG: hypothetical protein J6386_01430 [Candidatus Synoicihabitans palmerolidicus]|nr:hypothetical protein [Candidatus Synoicihabitans palmerolidicus]